MHDIIAQAQALRPGEVTLLQADYVSRLGNFISFESGHYENIIPFLKSAAHVWQWISLPISLFCIVGIVVAVDGLAKIRKAEHKYYYGRKIEEAEEDAAKPDEELGKRWRHVLDRVGSENESDWRQAIIDADSILDEILVKMGYQGAGIGERLQRVAKGDMKTLDQAWEAHKVRNHIAHDGTAFPLTQHEAKRVINLYKEVFAEFYYV